MKRTLIRWRGTVCLLVASLLAWRALNPLRVCGGEPPVCSDLHPAYAMVGIYVIAVAGACALVLWALTSPRDTTGSDADRGHSEGAVSKEPRADRGKTTWVSRTFRGSSRETRRECGVGLG